MMNPMEALTRLRQINSTEDNKAKFEALSNRYRGLSYPYKLRCFQSGLKDEIRPLVKMFNASNLITTYSLAKL